MEFKRDTTLKVPHHSSYLGDGHRRIMILGASRSGKSYWCLPEVLKFMEKPEITFIISPNYNQQTYQTLIECNSDVNYICAKSLDDIKELVLKKNKKKSSITVIDDFFGQKELKHPSLRRLFSESAHLNNNVILISQNYFDADRYIRDNLNMICILKYPHIEQVYRHGLDAFFNSKQDFLNMYNDCISEEGGFLTVDMDCKTPDFLRVRKKIDQIPQRVFDRLSLCEPGDSEEEEQECEGEN